jgi:ubiquinone/menaquinone biosynthesis C-methylase UbiE
VLDLGTGTGWVAIEARWHTSGRIVGIDISPNMVAEARQHTKDKGLHIAYLTGDMITLQVLDAIKPARGFDVITCLWAFSNVAPGRRLAMLNRWTEFLAPHGADRA